MVPSPSRSSYSALVALADRLLEDCEDDAECLALRLGGLEAAVRDELLVSDLLNAWQVFFFFFRTDPGDLPREQMELEPASSLLHGILVRQTDLLEMFFYLRGAKPVIAVSDGEQTVATFSGSSAFDQGLEFLERPEYR